MKYSSKYVRGRCTEPVLECDHLASCRVGAFLPPFDGGRKARRYAELVNDHFFWRKTEYGRNRLMRMYANHKE